VIYYAIFDAGGSGQYHHGYGHGGARWRFYPKLWRRRGDAQQALRCLQRSHYKDKRAPKLVRFFVTNVNDGQGEL
jgi:hypothetical protein